MANDSDNPPLSDPRGSFHASTRSSRIPTSRSSTAHGYYTTAEPSITGRDSFATGDSTLAEYQDDERPRHTARDDGRRRSYRQRTTGGFLLSNPVSDEHAARSDRAGLGDGRRRSRIPVDSRRAVSPIPPEKASPRNVALLAPEPSPTDARFYRERPTSSSRIPSPRQSTPPMDIDTTQIVNMALNLSESRRLAQRRNVSTPIPPRLAQLPDNTAGGTLRQHLQQQRRTSHNASLTPERAGNTPIPQQRLSPLQASFDPDSSYTYHFSTSTSLRAQKAKEHFELMAQYIRLLQVLPPLETKGQGASRPSTSSPPASPGSSSPTNPLSGNQPTLGRPYNPLQYIRNRKVRARERKAIDGEALGFGDVNKVTGWVDQVATLTTASSPQPGASVLPPFPGAELMDQAPASNIPVLVSNASKPKRLKMDWIIEPADMLADIYWVEQGGNKSLIEDRHYVRVFPKGAVTSSVPSSVPMSPEPDESHLTVPLLADIDTEQGLEGDDTLAELRALDHNPVSRTETELSHANSTRERARQKLHELRGLHHHHHHHHDRHGSSHGHYDFLHLRKSSFSDTSDSEVDRRKFARRGTVSADSEAILEKQMNALLAQEAMAEKKDASDDASVDPRNSFTATLMTPERPSEPFPAGKKHAGSRAEGQEPHDRWTRGRFGRSSRHSSPIRSGRTSLEVPGWNGRSSMDMDTSSPPSPELGASVGAGHIPAIGMDLSPASSRPSSPGRNPFSKVKSIFRDRSRERGMAHSIHENEQRVDSPPSPADHSARLSPVLAEGLTPLGRRRSRSSAPRPPRVETHKSHKAHKSVSSLKLGKDEQVGLRSILKGGAKIDGIIRGGVSKVSDLLWRKDQDDDSSSSTSSDDSDAEPARGRKRAPAPAMSRDSSIRPDETHQPKNYLHIMPPFKSASEVDQAAVESDNLTSPEGLSRPESRRSKLDRLKPLRMDVLDVSAGLSPIPSSVTSPPPEPRIVVEVPETEPCVEDPKEVTTDARGQFNPVLDLTVPTHRGSITQPRHWSITNLSGAPQHSSQLSKREVARLRALALSSGIKAMEIARRSHTPRPLSAPEHANVCLPWTDLVCFSTSPEQAHLAVPQLDLYPAIARILSASISASEADLEKGAKVFVGDEMRQLHGRVDALHTRVASELIDMTRRATDEADECSRDVVASQRLKVKRVVDIIDKMMRRRRRRFRWVRRGGWLLVEWVVIGFMWYVWFLVVIARMFLGVGRGAVNVVRWLLWL